MGRTDVLSEFVGLPWLSDIGSCKGGRWLDTAFRGRDSLLPSQPPPGQLVSLRSESALQHCNHRQILDWYGVEATRLESMNGGIYERFFSDHQQSSKAISCVTSCIHLLRCRQRVGMAKI